MSTTKRELGFNATATIMRFRQIAAGIYAKAMVVRASKTGAAGLAMSLAEDLISCEELRKSLWPAEVPAT